MDCVLDFRDRKIDQATALIYNPKAVAYNKVGKDTIVITPGKGSQIKTLDQAYNAAVAMEKKIAKELGEHYNFKTYGKWTTIIKGHNNIKVKVAIPPSLLNAYRVRELKKQTSDYNTETAKVEEAQKGQLSFFDMANTTLNLGQINAIDQVNPAEMYNYKQEMLNKTNAAIQAERGNKAHDRTHLNVINKRIRSLEKTKIKLENDLLSLKSSNIAMGQINAIVKMDLDLIDRLLENPSLEDIHNASKILNFYNEISNPNDIDNKFLIAGLAFEKGKSVLEPEVKDMLDNLSIKVSEKQGRLYGAKRTYLQEIIDTSEQVQEYIAETGQDIEIEELLKPIKDIDYGSKYFLTIDKQYASMDTLLAQLMKIEFDMEKTSEKSKVSGMVQRMDAANKDAQAFLPKTAAVVGWFNAAIGNASYAMFYQKNSIGASTGKLINRYSSKWENIYQSNMRRFAVNKSAAYAIADASDRADKIDTINRDAFNWHDSHTEFVDVTQMPEIIADPDFAQDFIGIDTSGADAYKADLIARIGKNHYNQILIEQVALLQDYKGWVSSITQEELAKYGATSLSALPQKAINSITIRMLRNDPFELVKSQKTGQQGAVDFVNGNTSMQIQGELKYNSFIPKAQINQYNNFSGNTDLVDSGYYNEDFKHIESTPELYELWESFEKCLSYINMTLADAEKMLVHGSVLSMQKSFFDILFDPMGMSPLNKTLHLGKWLGTAFKSQFETAKHDKDSNDFDNINKSQFQSQASEAAKIARLVMFKVAKIKRAGNQSYKEHDEINLDVIVFNDDKVLEIISKELGSPVDPVELAKLIAFERPNNKRVTVGDLIKMFAQKELARHQSTDLPVLIRAFTEMTAEYKAQRGAKPKMEIFKEFYDSVKRENTKKGESWAASIMNSKPKTIGTERVRAKTRMDNWYNKNIKGITDVNVYGKVFDTYTAYEKELMKELKEKLKDPNIKPEEKAEITLEIETLGKNISLTGAYNAIFNKFAILKGLWYGIKNVFTNRSQGLIQGAVQAGRYYSEDSFYKATAFIMYKGLSRLPSQSAYKEEVKKVRLLINLLNVIQDATNEIDRARRSTGKDLGTDAFTPYYLTEVTEWSNQSPQILAMLGDQKIKDVNGVEYPIFNGSALPAYDIVDGRLKLRPEFSDPNNVHTKDNIATWENVSNREAGKIKLFMSEVIAITHGDYSKEGVTYIKTSAFGKTAMLFKGWQPNSIWSRISYKQNSLILKKKNMNGIYTSHRSSTLAMSLGAYGFVAAGPVGLAIAGGIGVLGGRFISKKMDRETGGLFTDFKVVGEMAKFSLAIAQKMAALPVNILSGRQVIKNYNIDDIAVSEEDKQNLQSMITEMSVLLSFILFKILLRAAWGNGDEDEPKTLGDGRPNAYYGVNVQSEAQKTMYFILENQISGMIGELESFQNLPSFVLNTGTSNILFKTLKDIIMLPINLKGYFVDHTDKITKGTTYGQSKLGNNLKSLLMPSVFKSLGFEKAAERDFNDTEYIDSMFDSDYKKDRKALDGVRGEYKEEKIEELMELYDYEDETGPKQVYLLDNIEKRAAREANRKYPYPARGLYDAEQMKIPKKKKK